MSDYRYPANVSGPYTEPAPEKPSFRPAELFREMAERIERNDTEEFAGAVLVVPPLPVDRGFAWEPIAIMLVNPDRDQIHFWSTVRWKINNEAGKWDDLNNTPPPGRMR